MKKYLLLPLTLLIINCKPLQTSERIVKFTNKPDEITTTENLKKYLDGNPNPKIVLRTSAKKNEVTETENINYLYNVIESELLKNEFVVRDRQLFEKILADSDTNNNYKKLKEKSDTDLIIELTNLDRSIKYQTNKYYNSRGEEKTTSINNYVFAGATIEFKIIMIDSNQFAGIYKFNYVPCVDGCDVSKQNYNNKNESDNSKPYEIVDKNTLVDFVKIATNKLVIEMRK